MADVSQSSILKEDPLHAYSGLSLFPRTLKSLSNPLSPSFYQSDDLQHTHTILESMPFEIQNEHQEQAKAILDESSRPLNQDIGTSVASEDTNVGVKVNPIPNKRERRPGLDRKRRQFSLNFTTSQPPPSAPSAPSFDGSKYPNPDDYFAEYDKFENASREWQKQTGINVIDTHQNPPSKRSRRPGIPGRKRASYKHTYTDTYFTDAINLEASEKENPIPSEQSLERTTAAPLMTADTEVDDSTVDTDKNLQNILSELLACNHDELEGDGAVKLLEDRLQIKSFNVEKLSIPEFQDIREMNLKASGRNPSKRKSVLSDIQNMLKGNRDGVRKNSHSPFPLTEKRFSSSNPPEDQFSFPDIHNLLPGDLLSSEVEDQPRAKDSNICSSSSVTKDTGKDITNTSPSNVGTVDVASPLNSSVQMSSSNDDSDTHSGINKFHRSPDGNADNCVDASITNRNSATLEVNLDMQTKGSEGGMPMSESGANRKTGRRASDDDIDEETDSLEMLADYASREVTRIDPFTVERDNIPYQQDASSQSPNRDPEQFNTMDGSFEHAEHVQGQRGEESGLSGTACGIQVESAQEVHNSSQEQTKERRKRGSCDSSKEKRSKTVHGESEGDKQMKTTLPHESGTKKQTQRKSNEREKKKQKKTFTRESKMFSRRKSLAGAGTKFESGVRRSTRIKSRPLEYWRGERFLYGRIHESLTTVIGIKYGSPGDGKIEKRATKVKSFVSDEYKELLDFAALH